MTQKLLKCDLHDYLEIACLFRVKVELTLKDNTRVVGMPITIKIDSERNECVVVMTDGQQTLVQTNSLSQMRALVVNHHFDVVEFA
jgi:Rho-binding antiterminator